MWQAYPRLLGEAAGPIKLRPTLCGPFPLSGGTRSYVRAPIFKVGAAGRRKEFYRHTLQTCRMGIAFRAGMAPARQSPRRAKRP